MRLGRTVRRRLTAPSEPLHHTLKTLSDPAISTAQHQPEVKTYVFARTSTYCPGTKCPADSQLPTFITASSVT